jgi:hypothetical protein
MRRSSTIWILATLGLVLGSGASEADDRPDQGSPSIGGEWNTYSDHSGDHPHECTGNDGG